MEAALAGVKLEKYKLLSKLSKGGMAWVYLAEHELLKKKVAVKILLPELARNKEMVERFLREARAAAGLNHPNIIRIHDVGQVAKVHYIAMDFIDGPRLTDHIASQGRLDEREILRISRQVLGAIGEAHANQIIHRDLKPHNIMLDHRGDVVIMDFGIAKAAYNSDMTATGSFLGTAKYASPEQVRGEKITPVSDLYSWGIVMFEMATGQTPFTGKDVTTLIYQHLNKTPSAPMEINPRISPELNGMILKCLEKEPKRRFRSAVDLCGQIDRLAGHASPTTMSPGPLADEKTRVIRPRAKKNGVVRGTARRRFGRGIAMGLLILVCVTAAGWWGFISWKPATPLVPPSRKIASSPILPAQPQTAVPAKASVQAAVEVWTDKQQYRVGESIKIHFRARDDSYIFLYHQDARGRPQMIFPSRTEENNFVVGGLTNTIPDPNATFDFIVQPPTGTERIKALSTRSADQAAQWRQMDHQQRLTHVEKQKDLLVFEVVN